MTSRTKSSIAIAILLALSPFMALAKEPAGQAAAAGTSRPATWAIPVTVAGVPNLNLVDKNFYRSAQPEAAGFKSLAKDPGIKTVVSLRAFHSDKDLLEGTGMKLVWR